MRAIIVAAVSSAEQASEEKDSIPGQLAAGKDIRRLLAARLLDR